MVTSPVWCSNVCIYEFGFSVPWISLLQWSHLTIWIDNPVLCSFLRTSHYYLHTLKNIDLRYFTLLKFLPIFTPTSYKMTFLTTFQLPAAAVPILHLYFTFPTAWITLCNVLISSLHTPSNSLDISSFLLFSRKINLFISQRVQPFSYSHLNMDRLNIFQCLLCMEIIEY